MSYHKDNQEFTKEQIRQIHKDVGYSNPMQLGYIPIIETSMPTVTELQKAIPNGWEVRGDGLSYRVWQVVNKFDTVEQEQSYLDEIKQEKLSQSISVAQCKIQLLRDGLLDTVETYVQNSNDDELKIAWVYASKFSRTHALFTQASVALGLTEEQIDTMYLSALDIDIV